MRQILISFVALMATVWTATDAASAPFAVASFHKGRSALVYDTSTVERQGPYLRAWVYLIVATPMDGATMVATRREFICGVSQSRDLARRFVSAQGETLRAVETPGAWQFLEPGLDDYDLLERVCGRKAAGPATGKGLTVFDYHDAVQTALGRVELTKTASR